jgi:rhodanese-related sulfurtransferase
MSIKILFAPGTGKLLGAQIVGNDGVDKRLDLLATVIKCNGTIYDLIDIEHAYAPPYSSAKDPVNMAGYVAENILTGKVNPIYWKEIKAIDTTDSMLLDVRTPGEFKSGSIPGAVNIPVDELRNRLPELPLQKKIIIFCAVGLRGYIATRILTQNGFNRVSNLSGGYKTWETAIK